MTQKRFIKRKFERELRVTKIRRKDIIKVETRKTRSYGRYIPRNGSRITKGRKNITKY